METKLNLKHYLELKGTLVALKKLGRDYAEYFHHRYHDVITMSMLSREFRERYLDSSDLPGQLTA